MEKILYIDCFSGISGDMMIGALIDTGIGLDYLKNELKKVNISGYTIESKKVKAGPISAQKFDVRIIGEQPPRDYENIKNIIDSSGLEPGIKKISLNIFEYIATAEAKIHDQEKDKIHFHEVGALDSIIDIVGTAIAVNSLKIDKVYCSRVPLGRGFVNTDHGILPVPGPATLEILKGVPVYEGNFDFEVTTPTGAAIARTLSENFGAMPSMDIIKTGYGAGSRKNTAVPNALRILVGETEAMAEEGTEDLVLLSTNIDDTNPEIIGYVLEELYRQKTKDVWVENIYMKKYRPAFKLCVICSSELEQRIIDIIFSQTTTLGIRREKINRYCLERVIEKVRLPYGEVEIKKGIFKGKVINISPEFESCKRLAKKTGRPLKEIYQDTVLFFSKR